MAIRGALSEVLTYYGWQIFVQKSGVKVDTANVISRAFAISIKVAKLTFVFPRSILLICGLEIPTVDASISYDHSFFIRRSGYDIGRIDL